jgi:hypothetical protein
MGYCTYHIQKGKASAGGLGNHIDRIPGYEHSFNNADPSRTHLNISYPCNGYEKMSLPEAIEKRIKEGYNARNKAGELKEIRKDSCRFSEHVFTGTHEDLKAIEADPQRLQDWVLANRKFAEEMYGADNIVRFTLHLDETTPHIHCVIVNLTKDGRLSAKEILGNPKELQRKQDKYAEYMKPFGLERGLKDTGIQHENSQEYYKRVNASKNIENLDIYKRNIVGKKILDTEATLDNYKSKIMALEEEKSKYKRQYEGMRKMQLQVKDMQEKNEKKEASLKKIGDEIAKRTQEIDETNKKIEELTSALGREKATQAEEQRKRKELEGKVSQLNIENDELKKENKKYDSLKEYDKYYILDSIRVRESYEKYDIKYAFEQVEKSPKYRTFDELEDYFWECMKSLGYVALSIDRPKEICNKLMVMVSNSEVIEIANGWGLKK